MNNFNTIEQKINENLNSDESDNQAFQIRRWQSSKRISNRLEELRKELEMLEVSK